MNQRRLVSKKKFTTWDINAIFDVNRNRLQPWITAGFIKLTQPADRQGTKNLFSLHDLYRLYLFLKLLDAGFSRQRAKKTSIGISFDNVGDVEDQNKYSTEVLSEKLPANRAGYLSKEAPSVDLKDDESFALVVNLVSIKKQVDKLIEQAQERNAG